jgi:hypothetical protein
MMTKSMQALAMLALFGASLPVHAALPPQYQRTAELKAILDHPGVVGAFSGRPIDRVEWIAEDQYRVTSGACVLEVAIVGKPLPPGVVGGRRFDVVPGTVDCSSSE